MLMVFGEYGLLYRKEEVSSIREIQRKIDRLFMVGM
jgi:hypothetical protein